MLRERLNKDLLIFDGGFGSRTRNEGWRNSRIL